MDEVTKKWILALSAGDLPTVEQIAKDEGINLNDRIPYHTPPVTPLCLAATRGNRDLVDWLLNQGAGINVPSADTATALMCAAREGHKEVVEQLLNRHADPNIQDGSGWTAADFARSKGHLDLMRLILSNGGKRTRRRTVVVTGAGFTRAFYQNAPLIRDKFGVKQTLLPKYERFALAKELLESELQRQADEDTQKGWTPEDMVNLERLMTRVTSGMPYDSSLEDGHIFTSLLADLKNAFLDRINEALNGSNSAAELDDLAYYSIARGVNYITFNYDTLFDDALLRASQPSFAPNRKSAVKNDETAWRYNSGYGFYCRSSSEMVGVARAPFYRMEAPMRLLKIHGSMNWYMRLGAKAPYQLGDFVHHEQIGRDDDITNTGLARLEFFRRIESALEQEPFIVPPVLSKSGYMAEPLLQLLWSSSLDLLRTADTVIFVGYSLPVTDIAASYLFREGCVDFPDDDTRPEIYVVDFARAGDTAKMDATKSSYRTLFPSIPDDHFRFDGAGAWAADFVTTDFAAPKLIP